jgi:hypothetical protein
VGEATGTGAARGSPAAGPTSGRVRGGRGRRVERPGEAQKGLCSCSPESRVRQGFGARIPYTSVPLRPPLGPPLRRPPPQPRKISRSHLVAPDYHPLNAETCPTLHHHNFRGRKIRDHKRTFARTVTDFASSWPKKSVLCHGPIHEEEREKR